MTAHSGAPHADAARLRVFKNTAVLLALRVGMPMISVAVVLAVSRYLGTEGLGRYTLAFSFLYFASTLAPLGLYALITREGARDRSQLGIMLSNSFLLGGSASLLLMVGTFLIANQLGYDAETERAVVLLSLSILPATLVTFCEGAFSALERMEYIAIESLAENLVKVGGGVALLSAGYGLEAAILSAVVGRFLALFVCLYLIHRAEVGFRLRWDSAGMRHLATAAPTFLMISIFATLYWRIDVFMLSKLRTVEDVGYYGAAYRLLELAMVVPQSLCLALYPQLAQMERSGAGLLRLGVTTQRYLTALTLPVAIGTTLLAGPVLTLLYGPAFEGSAPTLAVLIWTIVPYAWVRYHSYVLVAAERQRIDLLLNVLMSGMNIALNFVLIPRFGHLGAAAATFVSICLYGVGQFVYFRRHAPGRVASMQINGATLGACVAFSICLWLVGARSPIAAMVIGPVVYVVVLVGAGFFSAEEVRMMRLERIFRTMRIPLDA